MRTVHDLIQVLRPKPCPYPLKRIGGDADGAYLVPDDLDGVRACFSPGVQNRKAFEDELSLNHGIACHMCDYTSEEASFTTPLVPGLQTFKKLWLDVSGTADSITLDSWVGELSPDPQNDLVLQMDIDGAEYRNLLATDESVLARFRIVVIELHHLRTFLSSGEAENEFFALLELLDRHFTCVHAHPNNCCGTFYCEMVKANIPNVIELTFLRRDRFSGFAPDQMIAPMLPHPLDIVGNVPHNPPLHLDSNWLGCGPRQPQSEQKILSDKASYFERSLAQKRDDADTLANFLFSRLRVGLASPTLHRGPSEDIALGKPYVLSSAIRSLPLTGKIRQEEPFFFSTRYQLNPAITIDLLERRRLAVLAVKNRIDAAQERARFLFYCVHDTRQLKFEDARPLNIEGSFLGKGGEESRTDLAGAEGRFVTIFSPERTWLHLSSIRIYALP